VAAAGGGIRGENVQGRMSGSPASCRCW